MYCGSYKEGAGSVDHFEIYFPPSNVMIVTSMKIYYSTRDLEYSHKIEKSWNFAGLFSENPDPKLSGVSFREYYHDADDCAKEGVNFKGIP